MRVRPLILGLLVLTVLTGSVVVADSRLSSSPTPTVVHPRPPALSWVEPPFVRTVQVDGRSVPVLGLGTVGDALRLAGADLMAGRLVGVVTHRGLGSDHKPGHALLDGVAVPLETPIARGSVITRVSGADAVEPVETVAAWLGISAALVASMSGAPFDQFFAPEVFTRSIPLLVLAGVGYLIFILAANVVMRVYLLRDLWVRVLASTVVHDIEAAANVSARGELANALGEGFADGLDVAGF